MARISTFKVNSKAIETGEWVRPGPEFDDLEILTRGFTDTYTDTRSARIRKAAGVYGGDVSRIPAAVARSITVECMISTVLLDVRNLADDTGAPVLFPAFCDLLRDPDYPDILTASIKAAQQVGVIKTGALADATGN